MYHLIVGIPCACIADVRRGRMLLNALGAGPSLIAVPADYAAAPVLFAVKGSAKSAEQLRSALEGLGVKDLAIDTLDAESVKLLDDNQEAPRLFPDGYSLARL